MRTGRIIHLAFLCVFFYAALPGNATKRPDQSAKSASQRLVVTEYGAVGNGTVLCTEAINEAIADCSAQGGGQVYFPPGTYLSGTIVLKDNVEIYLERGSTLLASTRHQDFPRMPQPRYRSQKDPGGWFAFIFADEACNIGICGFGTIDGQGSLQEPRPELLGGDRDGRPRSILFISSNKIRIEGITMINSGIWNQHYLNCEDLIIDKVEVYNHANRNNDGIDIDGCRRVILSNSIFDSDDDGITLKSTGSAPCEDICISNCIVSSWCNGIKAGTESTGGFKNITISNCIVKKSRSKEKPFFYDFPSGITGISLEIVDGGTMEGVNISNITIDGTMCPLYIRLGNRARKHTNDAPTPKMGTMKNISVSNLVCYNTGNYSSSITAIPNHYIENITLSNIQLFNEGGLKEGDYLPAIASVDEDESGYPQPTVWGELPSAALFIRHAKNVMIQGMLMGSEAPDPRVPVIAHDVEGLSIKNTRVTKNYTAETFFQGKNVRTIEVEKPLGWTKTLSHIE